jgi:signal peptidase I
MSGLLKVGATVVCVAVAALAVGLILMPAMFGLQRFVISGSSMTGTIDRGSVIYTKLTPVDRLRVGDIVTFVPPGEKSPVTHRIVGIELRQGERVFRTKGDFNRVADPWRITFPQAAEPRCVFHVPFAGYPLAILAVRPVRFVLIGLPAILIAASLLVSLWRSAGEEVRRREAAQAEAPSAPAQTG